MPLADRQRIYTWIDGNVPYYGTYEYNTNENIRGMRDRWVGPAVTNGASNWLERDVAPVFRDRCYDCHAREIEVARFGGLRKVDVVTSDVWTDRAFMSHNFPGSQPLTALIGPEYRINLTHPKWSQLLIAPLAKEAGGLGLCRSKKGKPYIFRDTSDKDYQRMLRGIEKGNKQLDKSPRIDMFHTAAK